MIDKSHVEYKGSQLRAAWASLFARHPWELFVGLSFKKLPRPEKTLAASSSATSSDRQER